MNILIVTNGEINHYDFYQPLIHDYAYVIAVDGGIRHFPYLNIVPDVVIGDMDSIASNLLKQYDQVKAMSYPSRKNFSDTELAVFHAISLQADTIDIWGGLGSRLDHSMANIYLLKQLLRKKIFGRILNEYNDIFLFSHSLSMEGNIGLQFSLLPLSESIEGLTIRGSSYDVSNINIAVGQGIGLSNRIVNNTLRIHCKKGPVCCMISQDGIQAAPFSVQALLYMVDA